MGYAGGTTKNPSYEEVCTGKTGHAESVEVTFDPDIISYDRLLEIFWKLHDPTTLNRQGPDIGTQYRSIIFYHTQQQKQTAEASKIMMQKTLSESKTIVTEIMPVQPFYPAEEYHQKYFEKQKKLIR